MFDRLTTYFLYQILQNRAAIIDSIQENGKFTFLSFLGPPLFYLFLPPFALIRITLGFIVFFLIRVTLGFEFFGPNKSHTLIRVTLGSNESKTIRATMGGYRGAPL